jgi:hypothetical protein
LHLTFPKREEFAKIPDSFVKNRISIRFPTRIGIVGVVKGTVQAAPQIGSTVWARITPTDSLFGHNLTLAVMT